MRMPFVTEAGQRLENVGTAEKADQLAGLAAMHTQMQSKRLQGIPGGTVVSGKVPTAELGHMGPKATAIRTFAADENSFSETPRHDIKTETMQWQDVFSCRLTKGGWRCKVHGKRLCVGENIP